jgi:hypothetical protein
MGLVSFATGHRRFAKIWFLHNTSVSSILGPGSMMRHISQITSIDFDMAKPIGKQVATVEKNRAVFHRLIMLLTPVQYKRIVDGLSR